MSCTDTAQLARDARGADRRALESAVREPVAVTRRRRPRCYNVRIVIRRRVRRGARRHRGGVGLPANVKKCSWSIPTSTSSPTSRWSGRWRRASSGSDSVVASVFRTIPLDRRWRAMVALVRAGDDLTMPIGSRRGSKPRSRRRRTTRARAFPSVEAALRDGPKYYEDLMTALGSSDGREIVLALDALRQKGRLKRDTAEGRYSLAD